MTDFLLRRFVRIWAVPAAAVAAVWVCMFRHPVPVPAAAAALPPVAPPPVATQQDMQEIDALIAREERRTLGSLWLEVTIVAASLALLSILFGYQREPAIVLVHDLRQGEPIDGKDVAIVNLPHLEHVFSSPDRVRGLLAIRDLSDGTVIRTTDVARPEAVASANIAEGEVLDAAKNIAFKPLPYIADALTPYVGRKKAGQFVAAGSVIRTNVAVDVPAAQPTKVAADEIEIPMRAFAGALAPAAGAEVMVVATPRGNGPSAVFENVRVVSADSTREPVTMVVAMKRAEALRFAALPAADLTLMRARR